MPENITPEEEKEFRFWLKLNGYEHWRNDKWIAIGNSRWGMKTKADLYAIFKKESEDKPNL
jgi:hypothetical protein